MNDNAKKVVQDLVPQLVMFLVLAIWTGFQSGAHDGLVFAGIALLTHVLWAPVYYAYLQRKTRIEAAKDEQRRKEREADAPNRAMRAALAKAIADHIEANPAGGAHA